MILATWANWSLGRKQDTWQVPSSLILGFRAVTIDLSEIRETALSMAFEEVACIITLRNVEFLSEEQFLVSEGPGLGVPWCISKPHSHVFVQQLAKLGERSNTPRCALRPRE